MCLGAEELLCMDSHECQVQDTFRQAMVEIVVPGEAGQPLTILAAAEALMLSSRFVFSST